MTYRMDFQNSLRCLKEYLEQTTIHGLRYLSEGKSIFEKLVWFLVISISFSFAGFYIHTTVKDNEYEPVLTTIETATIKDVPFPAITIRADDR